jgi:3-hydroxyacyl-CoA dehydrogenase
VLEASRCLSDGIVGTPTELDMALIMGLGFPPFRGGLMKYADRIGSADLAKISERYGKLGPLYQATPQLQDLAKQGKGFYTA